MDELELDPIDVNCALLADYQAQLSSADCSNPAREHVIECLMDIVSFLRANGGGTYSPRELAQIENDILHALD